jgi:tRNA-dihydrouridine synthase
MEAPSHPTLVLAPMRGITTMHYRQAFVHHFQGLDEEIAPFISTVNGDRINPKLLKDILPENNSGLPLTPQLIGNNADHFIQMAHAIHDLGYTTINWNMGCPHKPIRKKKRGSGLLPHPDLVETLLDQICDRSPCAISVKVRLGITSVAELEKLIPIFNRYPLTEVIIHPRTAEQMYEGSVDLDAFESIFQSLEKPVCYNGDIKTREFFQGLEKRFPKLQRFMIGRGLLENPFLAEEIKGIAPTQDKIERLNAFHSDLLQRYERIQYSDHATLGKMKEFWTYQSIHLSNGRKMFKKLKKTQTLYSYKAIVDEFLSSAEWDL